MESMPHDPANDEAQLREELVAYLDGELDAEQSRRIEQRAAVEPDARRMLEEFDRTWHMLDELDALPTSEDFTRTTLEMVAVAAAEDAEKAKAERRGGGGGRACGPPRGCSPRRRPASCSSRAWSPTRTPNSCTTCRSWRTTISTARSTASISCGP